MKNNYMIGEETKAKEVGGFFSMLSELEPIKNLERNVSANGILTRIKNGYTSVVNKIKNSKAVRNAAIFAVAGATAFSLTGCVTNTNADGTDNGTSITSEMDDENKSFIPETSTFKFALNKSKSETQKKALLATGEFLADFNIRFATPFAEEVTIVDEETEKERTFEVKPALKWDEVMAANLVWNNYSKQEIIEILNAAEIDAYELQQDYNMGILQLMGSHVLETRRNPIKIDMLLRNQKDKAFYNKYHNLFLIAKGEGKKGKEVTPEERMAAAQKFYDELFEDFPITDYERQVGISHSDSRDKIEPGKFSIVPMVAAAEMLFQNYEIDHTMADQAIAYFNDIGACNIAGDILEKAEIISLMNSQNDDYADYDLVRAALIVFLQDQDAYYIDDEHRELTYLTAFQEAVNGFLLQPYSYVVTWTETTYFTIRDEFTTTDRDEAVKRVGEEAVAEAERKAQEALDRENEAAREEAEKEADKKADEIQKEEDEKKDDLQDKIDQDDKDFQDKIEDANDKIENGGTVNEGDLGGGVIIDDDHKDNSGNIDDSIKDITTDPSGDQTGEPLPDPNGDDYSSYVEETPPANNYQEPAYEEPPVYEYEEPYFESEEDVDQYIESLANQNVESYEGSYTYHL